MIKLIDGQTSPLKLWQVTSVIRSSRTQPETVNFLTILIGRLLLAAALFSVVCAPLCADSGLGDFLAEPTWSWPDNDRVLHDLEAWLAEQPLTSVARAEMITAWSAAQTETNSALDRLDRLAAIASQADPRIAELVEQCRDASAPLVPPAYEWLTDEKTPHFVRDNMRLYFARWLIQVGMYDEALATLADLTTYDVVAPEALLFCQAVAHHHLVHPDDAQALLTRLLERETELPRRYQQLGQLMLKDSESLQDESLDHIARRMKDIRRRLALARAGKTVQEIEDGVIESLDKLIEELEKQQQQQMSQQAQSGGAPSGTPMPDSRLAEMKGPGKVEQRDIGKTADWGDVPPKDREQALQEIGREFPSHYREVIEQYFRELASDSAATGR